MVKENLAGPLGAQVIISTISLAGWSSPVAREAHNLEVVGSNPAPATVACCDQIFERPTCAPRRPYFVCISRYRMPCDKNVP